MTTLLIGVGIGWLVVSRAGYRRRVRQLELMLLAEVERRQAEGAAAQDALAMMHEEAAEAGGQVVVQFPPTMFSPN